MTRRWSMKSKSIERERVPCGIGDVVRPRVVTYSVTCQEWLIHGDWTRRTFPTAWAHRWRVAQVSRQSAKGSDGQALSIPRDYSTSGRPTTQNRDGGRRVSAPGTGVAYTARIGQKSP